MSMEEASRGGLRPSWDNHVWEAFEAALIERMTPEELEAHEKAKAEFSARMLEDLAKDPLWSTCPTVQNMIKEKKKEDPDS